MEAPLPTHDSPMHYTTSKSFLPDSKSPPPWSKTKRKPHMKSQTNLKLSLCLTALLLLGCTLGHCEDQLFACYNQGFLTLEDEDRSVYVSSGGNTYLGRADENGGFIVLGRKPNTSAFGQIFNNGNVIILYSPLDEE